MNPESIGTRRRGSSNRPAPPLDLLPLSLSLSSNSNIRLDSKPKLEGELVFFLKAGSGEILLRDPSDPKWEI
jgi:hypothetical protein